MPIIEGAKKATFGKRNRWEGARSGQSQETCLGCSNVKPALLRDIAGKTLRKAESEAFQCCVRCAIVQYPLLY